jgi:cyclophilin family peptidyl-prolyl cis-trans isomerase
VIRSRLAPLVRPLAAGARLVALICVVAILTAGCLGGFAGGGSRTFPPSGTPSGAPVGSAMATGAPSSVSGACPTSQPAPLPAGQKRTLTIDTPKGAIGIEIDGSLSPIAAGNIVALAACGYYDGVVFHRLVPGFVIQGGDGQYGKKASLDRGHVGHGGPGYRFDDERFPGDYVRGALAMANAGPNTNGSQFFICHQDLTGKLPKNYTIFGVVTRGMDVVDQIASAPRDHNDLPHEPVAMTSVTIHEDEGEPA